jgi:uncharacterized protein YraI/Flp pilus assembly protein TadD
MKRLFFFLTLILAGLSLSSVLLGQSPQPPQKIGFGETLDIVLQADLGWLEVDFDAEAGDIVTIQLEALAPDADPTLIVSLYENPERNRSRRFAYDDDSGGGLNPAVIGLELPEAGTYSIRVGYIGQRPESNVPMKLSLSYADEATYRLPPFSVAGTPSEIAYGEAISGTIPLDVTGISHQFAGQAGDLVRAEMSFGAAVNGSALLYGQGSYLSTLITMQTDGSVRADSFILPEDRTYSITITRGGKLNVEMPYTFTLIREAVGVSPTPNPGACRQNAFDARDARDWAKAVENATCALDNNANDFEMLRIRASALTGLARHAEALVDYEALLALSPFDGEFNHLYGVGLYNTRQYAEAVAAFDLAESYGYDGLFSLYFFRGAAKSRLGEYSAALEDLYEVVNASPGESSLYAWIGDTLWKQGDFAGAELQYSRYVALADERLTPAAYVSRGNLYLRMRDLVNAELDALEALKNSSGYAVAHELLVMVKLARQDFAGALNHLETATIRDGDPATLAALKGQALTGLGRTDEAKAAYAEALAAADGAGADALRESAAAALLNLGDASTALSAVNAIAEPELSALLVRAVSEAASGDAEDARATYSEVVSAFGSPALQPLTNGQAVEIQAEEATLHRFLFEGAAGDVIIATVNTRSPHASTLLTLVDPSGAPLMVADRRNNADPALVDVTLPATGTYELAVMTRGDLSSPAAVVVTGIQQATEVNACVGLVQNAYRVTAQACGATGRDEACYGNALVNELPDSVVFEQAGDLLPVMDIDSLRLGGMDASTAEWGISLMRLRANLPEDALELVDVVLFGQIQMGNFGAGAAPVNPLTVAISGNINVRSGPSTNVSVVTGLAAGQSVQAIGRNAAGDWLQIELADGNLGWVFAPLVSVAGDIQTLPVADDPQPAADTSAGIQAFTFSSGTSDRPCDQAPDSGLLIQTPEGAGRVSLLINEVIIELGSTAYLTAHPGREMHIYLLEGSGTVTAEGVAAPLLAGTVVTVPLGIDGLANGAPIGPNPYNVDFGLLPLDLLSQQVTPAAAPTELPVVDGAPSSGAYEVEWTINNVLCHTFDNSVMDLLVLEGGRMIRFNVDGYGQFHARWVEPGVYRTAPAALGGFGIGGAFDPSVGRIVETGVTDIDYWTLRFETPTDAVIEAVRLRSSPRLGVVPPDEELEEPGCERVVNTAVLNLVQ